ncbi:MAG TPA: hypothetical protein VLE47_00350 [Candidatus Saccharimonadales bacterium]|nr:hypothetical protein [Candidatus Saccharimonadales bacterium]
MQWKICVSGAAVGDCLNEETIEKAELLGRSIAKHDAVLVTGATTGIPFYAARGAKKVDGVSIGFSPAATYQDHVKRYQLPTRYMDLIVYTGFGYAGRNLLLTRSADAVIVVCGRIGTLNEFTVAFEDKKPLGVLTGSGGIADEIKELTEVAHKHECPVIYEDDPDKLVVNLIRDLERTRVADNARERVTKPEKTD